MWPDADIFTAVYDEQGHRGPVRGAQRARPRSCRSCGRPRARSGRCCRCIRRRSSRSTCRATTWSCRAPRRGRTRCCATRTPSTSATATTRSATRGTTAEPTLARREPADAAAFLRRSFRRWRQWDWIAAQRTDRYVANSRITQARIRAYFGREADIVHPPVDTSRFAPGSGRRPLRVVSELMPHKQIDVAVRAFTQLQLPLIVVGDGPDARSLRRRRGRRSTSPAASPTRPSPRSCAAPAR